jgi:uroporphyrinogen-III synthase
MGHLNKARVALLEARMSSELAKLVTRLGGEPLSAPAVREATLAAGAAVATLLDHLSAGKIAVIFFLTGGGVQALLKEAGQLSRLESWPKALGCLEAASSADFGKHPGTLYDY